MVPDACEGNGWAEYRRLVLDWHEQDLADRREIRDRLERQEISVNTKLDAISTQLTALKTERKLVGWALGVGVPGAVALVVSILMKHWGF